MIKLAVFACFLVVCYAQPQPEPPHISETFQSRFTIFRKEGPGGLEERGEGMWDRSVELKDFVRTEEFKSNTSTKRYEHLGLWNQHEEYSLSTNPEGKLVCEKHQIPEDSDFPVVWDWLKEAHCKMVEDHRTNKTYEGCASHRGEEMVMLFVNPEIRNNPVALMTRRGGFEEDIRFMSFSLEPPPASSFTVPPECMTPPPHQRPH